MRDVNGEEHWAGSDGDFLRAVAWSPAAFTWVRARTHLVELPAIWVRIPLNRRDGDELAEEVHAKLLELNCPAPHLVVEGEGHLVALWGIEPFRRPRKSAPDEHHHAFRQGLTDWEKAALKLSFALEDLGAQPLDAAAVHALMHGLVPFPLPRTSPLRLAVEHTFDDPPRLIEARPLGTPLRVADISRPLARFDARMFDALGIARPRGKTRYLASPRTLEALEMTAAGERHLAARTIACACVWDGLDYAATLVVLRTWASKCVQDGKFPFRRRKGDELELLAQWAFSKLSAGGPDKVKAPSTSTRAKLPLVERAVLGFLASAGGSWVGSKLELAKQAGLWALEAGNASACPRTTLKRALQALKAAGDLLHTVARHGATWASTWSLPNTEISRISGPIDVCAPQVQSPQSTWAPAPATTGMLHSERGAGGRLPPAGGGPGGAEISFSPSPGEAVFDRTSQEPLSPTIIADDNHPARVELQSPEIGLQESVFGEIEDAALDDLRRKRPRQRQRRFTTAGIRRGEAQKRRRRQPPKTALPVITDELLAELSDVAAALSPTDRRALLERARAALKPRPSVLADFPAALRRRAARLRREDIQAAQAAEFEADTAPAPPPAPGQQPRSLKEIQALMTSPAPETTTTPTAFSFEQFRALQAAAATPLHDRPVQDRARLLLEMGLSVIPLQSRSKEPAEVWTEWQRTRMPTARMRRVLQNLGDDAGLAVICGKVSDLLVVDLDDEGAVEWARKNLPETPWRTKTARGEHWYFRHPAEAVVVDGELPWHGQLQGDGRYVVAPGSLHPDGHRYEAVGDWTKPKMSLPVFDQRWLRSVDDLRKARARILKQEEE